MGASDPFRVLVCGGRCFDDRDAVRRALEALRPTLVITGGADGADLLADEAAARAGIARVVFPANWVGEGRAAGGARNQRMLDEGRPDLVVAFPGTSGTADMIRRARKAGVPVIDIGRGQVAVRPDLADLI